MRFTADSEPMGHNVTILKVDLNQDEQTLSSDHWYDLTPASVHVVYIIDYDKYNHEAYIASYS